MVFLGGLIAGSLAVLIAPLANQKSSDPGYVDFCLKYMSLEMRREVAGMICVLTPLELDELLGQYNDVRRERWISEYWKYNDPIYTTAENEIFVEHYRRVAYAESTFHIPKWPNWDQRGEVYVRYGEPTFRQFIAAEVDQKGVLPEGEIWHYTEHGMTVVFEDPFSRGEYSYYVERVRGLMGIRLRNIEDPIDAALRHVVEDIAELPPPSIVIEQAYEEHMEEIGKFFEMLDKVPATFQYDFEQNRQPFVFSVDNFRGGTSIDRVDVNIEFEADLTPEPLGVHTRRYVATAVFWDADHEEAGRREQRLDFAVSVDPARASRIAAAQLVFMLPAGFYSMGVTLEDKILGRISSYRTDVTCVDLESKLAVSDILFASVVRPVARESPFNRGPLEVVPHASRQYRANRSIPIYFEVYNLARDERDVSHYTVEYRIGRREREEPSLWDALRGKTETVTPPDISSSFRMSGNGPYDVVHFTFRPENLRAGVYDLYVTVRDDLSEAEASRVAAFRIIE